MRDRGTLRDWPLSRYSKLVYITGVGPGGALAASNQQSSSRATAGPDFSVPSATVRIALGIVGWIPLRKTIEPKHRLGTNLPVGCRQWSRYCPSMARSVQQLPCIDLWVRNRGTPSAIALLQLSG